MLELKQIKKTYNVGGTETRALDGISVAFRQKEFVAILGTSGSGKTTCLNIIGGLDHYDSGEMTIKGKSTKDFKEKEWDAYRNNSVGFVFQSYNLIMHLSIVENVELGMTLSGVPTAEKHSRAINVLKKVGLEEHLHKKPNQLSGGQMQRVAIARALANDPEILLCDEPTGALDTTTSVQIMDLIKEVAQERLVIMVTHNPEIAENYADRIIRFSDGKIISDSNPHQERPKEDQFHLKRTSMGFLTALKLSFNNIRTKKGRTFLTSFASSIGIIGIAVILSISSGFQSIVSDYQMDALEEFPILITQTTSNMDAESIDTMREEMKKEMTGTQEYADSKEVFLNDPEEMNIMHKNIFTDEYLDYIDKLDPAISSRIGYSRIVSMNILRDIDGEVKPVSLAGVIDNGSEGGMMGGGMMSGTSMAVSSYPKERDPEGETYLSKNYDLMAGAYPKEAGDLILVIDNKNRLDYRILQGMGFETEDIKSIKFDDIIGTELKAIPNDVYYQKMEQGNFTPNQDYKKMFDSSESIPLKVVGVVRQSESVQTGLLSAGVIYSDELSEKVIAANEKSEIVLAQKDSDQNLLSMEVFQEGEKDTFISTLGGDAALTTIMVYPNSFESKEQILSYLDEYNTGKDIKDQVIYNDLASMISGLTSGIMNGITIVLIAFAAISLVVSLIMIAIITYTSVLERTKEIGVLKALGARKKDITRVFDAETCILGIFSGVLGVVIAWLLTFPINSVIFAMTSLENVSNLPLQYAVILVIISTVLTMLGGHIPARMASKRDAVEALRTE